MDQENLSRKQKIELARRMAGTGSECREGENHFFLRTLLSVFILLAVLGMTKFETAEEGNVKEYQTKVVSALKTQKGMDAIKELIAKKTVP